MLTLLTYTLIHSLPTSQAQSNLESFDDGMFNDGIDNPTHRAMKETLIPRGCLEPYEALQFFTHAFEARYGAMHPLFLIGTLSDAVSEATAGSATSGSVSVGRVLLLLA